MSTPLSLAFSPCPNDCFMFDAMIHGKIDTEGLAFDATIADVETLNKSAFKGEVAITKLSFHAFAHVTDTYILLDSGSALGKGCGPLLIQKAERYPLINDVEDWKLKVNSLKIAIPGKYTTANLLLDVVFPNIQNKIEMVFSSIEDAVLNNVVDAGVIIHENRFTYEAKGLKKIVDLGEYWEQTTLHPIPLGGIAVNRKLDRDVQEKINNVLKKSIAYAFQNPTSSRNFVKQYAQALNDEVIQKHIDLYVNNYSLDLAKAGKEAIRALYDKSGTTKIMKNKTIFLDDNLQTHK